MLLAVFNGRSLNATRGELLALSLRHDMASVSAARRELGSPSPDKSMNRLDRHDYILMARRKRQRAEANKPQIWKRIGQALLVVLLFTVDRQRHRHRCGRRNRRRRLQRIRRPIARRRRDRTQQDQFQTVRIYDRTGKQLLYESVDPRPFGGDRRFLSLDKMSPWVWKSAVALEDRNFWDNPGVNVRGLFRAFMSNLQGGAVQGGSSITQQLIKNVVIPVEERTQQSYARKIKEVILCAGADAALPERKAARVVPQLQLLRQSGLWRRSGQPGLFWQERQGPDVWPRPPCWPQSRSSRRSTRSTTPRTPRNARALRCRRWWKPAISRRPRPTPPLPSSSTCANRWPNAST